MAVADGTIGLLADEFGAPFNQIPTEMFWHCRGGFGWGALCGAIPPATCMLGMADPTDTQMELTDELMSWYQQHPFPEVQFGAELPTKVINSTLCHVSVTKWMQEAGIDDRGAPERSDRCAGVSADTAKKAVQLLNARLEGTFVSEFGKPATAVAGDCTACHDSGDPDLHGGYPAHGSEDCTECHTDQWKDYTTDHP